MQHAGSVWSADSASGPNLPYFFLERYTQSYLREWDAFTAYLQNGTQSPVPGRDGRAPVAIGLAAWESVRTGAAVAVVGG